jgi:hypothetical protein
MTIRCWAECVERSRPFVDWQRLAAPSVADHCLCLIGGICLLSASTYFTVNSVYAFRSWLALALK